MKNVGILIFNDVEVLDFTGPFEVFSLAQDEKQNKIFNTFTIAETDGILKARNGFLTKANFRMGNCPSIDILLVPGGYGAEKVEINNKKVINWLAITNKTTEITASICTGAFLLAKAGIITNQAVTTHWLDIKELKKQFPNLNVLENVKYVDNGKIITSAGISAGIDMSFHIVSKICGIHIAKNIARVMEYDWIKVNPAAASI